MTPGKVIYVLAVAAALALAVVYQSSALLRAGYRVHGLQAEIAEGRAESALYRAHLSKLGNPKRVLRLVGLLGLELEEPQVRLAERVPAAAGGTHPDAEGLRVAQRDAAPVAEAAGH